MMKNILVLEHESSIMKLMRHMLKPRRLIEATNAEEALVLRMVWQPGHQVILEPFLFVRAPHEIRKAFRSLNLTLDRDDQLNFPGIALRWRSREKISAAGLPFLHKPFTRETLRNSIEALTGPLPPLAMVAP